MKKPRREPDEDAARTTRRLLEALAEPQACGLRGGLDETTIVVAAPRNGVTLARARFPESAAREALSLGLVASEGEGANARLRLTEAGRAHLRRAAAPREAAFLAQHSPIVARAGEGAAPTLVDEGESPLAWLARRKDRDGRPFLTAAQCQAGERFRRDATQAQILQRVTVDWEARGGAGRGAAPRGPVADVAIDARRRLSGALEAVGPELAGLLTDVCGYLKGLELVESERGWPPRSAKIVLRIALERLALHYGLASEAQGPERSRRLLHWGAADYRPAISPE
jgi:hypothetical protein